MKTANITYLGALRTQATHLRSGSSILTDAPIDNHGQGEAFSPTDLVAAAAVSCMITVMGIAAQKSGLDMGEVTGSVEKIMSAEPPRRIAALNITLHFAHHSLSPAQQQVLRTTALACPVHKSLHPDIQIATEFVF